MVSGKPTGGMAELEHPSVLIADDDLPHRQAVREALERQLDLDQADVRPQAGCGADRSGSVARLADDDESLRLQRLANRAALRYVVVRDEDRRVFESGHPPGGPAIKHLPLPPVGVFKGM